MKKQNARRIARRLARYAPYAVAVVAIGGLVWFAAARPKLPPTTAQGHSEQSPPGHVVASPIPDAVQRHMLEHADGRGRPSVIIQYNCRKYSCETDLVRKLTDLVNRSPDNAYLAPSDYDAKIVLTKLNKSRVLDEFDEQAIWRFMLQ